MEPNFLPPGTCRGTHSSVKTLTPHTICFTLPLNTPAHSHSYVAYSLTYSIYCAGVLSPTKSSCKRHLRLRHTDQHRHTHNAYIHPHISILLAPTVSILLAHTHTHTHTHTHKPFSQHTTRV